MKQRVLLLILCCCCLGLPPGDSRAQDPPVPAVLQRDHALHSHFEAFALSRIGLLNRNYIHTQDNIHVEAGNPHFTARYCSVDPSTIAVEVKMTGSSVTPYVGVLRYIESTYESSGPCAASASKGPFSPVRNRQVTEIFRFSRNDWH